MQTASVHINRTAALYYIALYTCLNIYSYSYVVMSCFILFSTISPVVFGTVYSLSLSDAAQDIGFPVGFQLAFLLISCGFLLTMILVSFFLKG